jgi:hypothetical protein
MQGAKASAQANSEILPDWVKWGERANRIMEPPRGMSFYVDEGFAGQDAGLPASAR